MSKIIATVVISLVGFFGIWWLSGDKKSSDNISVGGQLTEKYIPIFTTHWTKVTHNHLVEWTEFGITYQKLKYTVVVDGDFDHPVTLPTDDGSTNFNGGQWSYHFSLNGGQGVDRSKIFLRKTPK